MIFAPMEFKLFIAMTRLEYHEFIVSLVWLFQYPKSSGCFSLTSRKFLPMGVKQRIFILSTMKSMISSDQ
jgi:hypothetical protein